MHLRMRVTAVMVVLVTLLQVNQALIITTFVNVALHHYLSALNGTWVLKEPLSLDLNVDYMADVSLTMNDVKVADVDTISAYDCIEQDDADGDGKKDIELNFASPKLTLSSPAYVINGTIVDHISLQGRGPAVIVIEDLDIRLKGKGIINHSVSQFYLKLDNASLNLEMRRWTVNFEDLMPGTDLGTLFNEFFSAHGQELLDMLEVKINNNGKLVDFINSLFELSTTTTSTTTSTAPATDASTSTTTSTTTSTAPATDASTSTTTSTTTSTAPATDASTSTTTSTTTSTASATDASTSTTTSTTTSTASATDASTSTSTVITATSVPRTRQAMESLLNTELQNS